MGGYRRKDPSIKTGMCMVTGTDQGLYAVAESADGVFELKQLTRDGESGEFNKYPADPVALREVAETAVFDSYAAGVASLILDRFPGLGLQMEVYRCTLPLKKGLSSSAAISVLTARAFNLIHKLELTIKEEMEFAYQGEILAGSACGRMDQVCAYGSELVVLTFDGDRMSVRKLKPARALPILIVDLRAEKDTRRILADLNAAFIKGDDDVRDALGATNHRILNAACLAVEQGDLETLGILMTEAQEIFDRQMAPASPVQLSSPKLHAVLRHPAARELTWGGKGVGSQGDGTAQFLCRGNDERESLAAALEWDMEVSCLNLTIPENKKDK